MVNIKISKDYICQISAQSYKQLRSYRHFKIHAYISLEGRTAATEMLLILKHITKLDPLCRPITDGSDYYIHTWCPSDFWKSSKTKQTRQVLSMIHSARLTVSLVFNIVFAWNLFCFGRFWKVATDWWTDNMCKNNYHYQPWLWIKNFKRKQCSLLAILWVGRVDHRWPLSCIFYL